MTPRAFAALGYGFTVGGSVPAAWWRFLDPLAVRAARLPVAAFVVSGRGSDLLLTVDDVEVGRGAGSDLLSDLLVLVRAGAGTAPGHVVLHAAAVRRGDAVVLIAGPSGSGKSTLAAGLVRVGWSYLGDELVGVTTAGAVVPCPTPPRLAADARAMLGLAAPVPVKVDLALADLTPAASGAGGPVTDVLFPTRGGTGGAEPVSPAVALALLAESVFAGPSPEVALEALSSLAAGARTHRVAGRDPGDALRLARAILGRDLTGGPERLGDPEDQQSQRNRAREVTRPMVP